MSAPARPVAAQPLATSTFVVEGMRCAGCIAKLEQGLAALPGVAAARVNFTNRRVRIDHLDEIAEDRLIGAIDQMGFTAHAFAGDATDSGKRESRRLVLAMAVAGFAMMNIMLLSVAVWSGADGATRQLFHWLSALIALPTVAYSGRVFFTSAWGALKRGRTNMDVPISIGVLVALAMSLYETALGGAHAYFDGVVMLLFFLLGGRFLDSVMRDRARGGVDALLRRLPAEATVIARDGGHQRRAIAELAPGMRLLVAAGERIAADGIVEHGESAVDRSLVTGESIAEPVAPGAEVLAGTVNLAAPLTVRVTRAGEATAIADIARLMESAGQAKSAYMRIADRASRLYAPAVHTLAALTLAGWLIAGAGWHVALTNAVAVLIITCPCALGLAVPVAQVVASGALMRAGVLVKDGSALERLAKADVALLDKTGTITLGRPVVMGGLPDAADERAILHALARASRHPAAMAAAAALVDEATAPVTDIVEEAGLGVRGAARGVAVRLGRPGWAGPASDDASIVFRIGGGVSHEIRVADRARDDAAAALARLGAAGLAPEMVSGDAPAVVDALAAALGIPGRARATPQDKYAIVRAAEADGRRVLMVGDGINDGPALKAAYVSMAPATASDVGQMAADLVFVGGRLMAVPVAVSAARRTMRVVAQNFALAIGYNVLAVPLAVAGFVTPLIAALAMSGSSLIVVANAMRLRGAAR
ncbi:heavy metal translocating P-type ATPase [uncultured Sphingomonas sp.]|uniref:heavy metal translocating P-type ATPase n=1 Tax=uncultured Sphingomonas sp. TaxID=158754 RepID=UPI00262B18E2|nr:heavy metal translocating P-type ATPase [uncultured Sphingomonas sp.]